MTTLPGLVLHLGKLLMASQLNGGGCEWLFTQPPAASPAISCQSSPMMLRTASLSLQGKTEENEKRSSICINKGRNAFMKSLSHRSERITALLYSYYGKPQLLIEKGGIWVVLRSFPTHPSALCLSEATWWFNLRTALNTPGKTCNSAFLQLTSHKIHFKNPIWSPYLN